jgi:hypothetical protein
MAQAMVTAPMARKAATLAELLPACSTGTSKLTGQRFYVVPASNRMTAHWTALDGSGCTCLGYQRRGLCTHAIAARTLHERQAAQQATVAPVSLKSYRDLYPGCIAGCGELVERKNQRCERCASDEAHRLEIARRRELVATL